MKQLLLLLLASSVSSKNVFVSSPFDNFRIECPKRAAATELSVRMVESVGQKRQDVVFDMSCETVEDLYPWVNIPVGVADIEREDCQYSEMMDPILDENTTFTCAAREYLAGVTRLSDTRIQTMCCRLRSRDEFNCKDMVFNKPIGLTRSTVIEHDNQLINAIRIEGRNYVVRFCDLAPRAIASIMTDEKIRSTTEASTSTTTLQPKTDPLKVFKTQKSLFQPRAESVKVAHFDKPSLPLVELSASQESFDISAQQPEPLPTAPPSTTRRHNTARLALVTLPPTTSTTTTTEEPITEPEPESEPEQILEETTSAPARPEESTFPQETPIFSQQLVEDIVRKIGTAQSEQKAAQIFQQSLNKLLQNANEKPIDAVAVQQPGPPAARPANDEELSKIHFDAESFPQPHSNKRLSKELLPLRRGLDDDETGSLQPVNLEARRRSPIRTHRPHVDIWSSEEDEETQKIMTEINGSVEMKEESTTTSQPKKKVVKKIVKKVVRAHRTQPTTTTSTTTTTEEPTTKIKTRRTRPTTTTRRPRTTTRKMNNSFFNSLETDNTSLRRQKSETETTIEPRRFRARTTTPSARRDLPAQRRMAENRLNQADNARDIDEETELSPFDDPEVESENVKTTTKQPPAPAKKPVEEAPKIEFQEDEELEEVISKLSSRRSNIRRAPVRNSFAEAQFSDKLELPTKDGVKTFKPKTGVPISMPGLETISLSNLEDFEENEDESIENITNTEATTKKEEVKQEIDEENLEAEDSMTIPTSATTTSYDPANFYRTPRPKPAKKESILRFCSKESAIRDQSNMVIACGLDQDIWTPNRCPENTDCFPSHDSLYRICCPVHRG